MPEPSLLALTAVSPIEELAQLALGVTTAVTVVIGLGLFVQAWIGFRNHRVTRRGGIDVYPRSTMLSRGS